MASNERAHWLAVHALGVLAAGNVKDAVTGLATQADHDAEVLDAARAHLEETYIGDATARERAIALLSAAIALADRAPPPPA